MDLLEQEIESVMSLFLSSKVRREAETELPAREDTEVRLDSVSPRKAVFKELPKVGADGRARVSERRPEHENPLEFTVPTSAEVRHDPVEQVDGVGVLNRQPRFVLHGVHQRSWKEHAYFLHRDFSFWKLAR